MFEAASGEEAHARLHTHSERVALLLSDVVLPSLSGVELATPSSSEGRGLLISGHPERAGAGSLLGVALLLDKPFTLRDLVQRVRDVLDAPARRAPDAPE